MSVNRAGDVFEPRTHLDGERKGTRQFRHALADGLQTKHDMIVGACDRAPVVMINNEHWHERLRPEDVPRFLEDLKTKGLPALTGCHLVPAGERR